MSENHLAPPKIFIAYAHEDAALLERLRKPLGALEKRGLCAIFWDGKIEPGERWDKRLKKELHEAQIIVLLLSDDFLDSDYVHAVELPKALELEKTGAARVVPILLRDCVWDLTELKELQVVMKNGQPISENEGYAEATRRIANVIESFQATLLKQKEAENRQKEAEKAAAEAQTDHIRQQAQAAKNRNAELEQFIRDHEQAEADRKVLEAKVAKIEADKKRQAAEAEAAEADRKRREIDPFHNQMIHVDGGTFRMGNTFDATISPFFIQKTPVTQAQWQKIMGQNPSHFKGENLPVEQISWDDIQSFLKKLNEKTDGKYRLPTEAEWEFAARGGTKSKGFEYAGSNDLNEVGWFADNSDSKTHLVAQKKANELGLFDMSGNVWEWCQDWYDSYPTTSQKDPKGPENGSSRVNRGGGWNDTASYCRSAYRDYWRPSGRGDYLGFRLVRVL